MHDIGRRAAETVNVITTLDLNLHDLSVTDSQARKVVAKAASLIATTRYGRLLFTAIVGERLVRITPYGDMPAPVRAGSSLSITHNDAGVAYSAGVRYDLSRYVNAELSTGSDLGLTQAAGMAIIQHFIRFDTTIHLMGKDPPR